MIKTSEKTKRVFKILNMSSRNKGLIVSKKAVVIFPFLLVFSLAILNSCGKSLEEKKQEEEKTTLSPQEKLELAKDNLEIGQVSEAKKLFIEALQSFQKDSTLYCEALWGKYLSDLFGTLDLLSQLISLGAEQSSTQQAPRIKEMQVGEQQQLQATQKYLEELDNLLGQSVESVIGIFLQKVNSMRKDLKEIVDLNCEMRTKAASKFQLSTPVITLGIWIPQNPEKSEKIPVYKKPSAYLNYSLLSLIAGVLDIAYSQNFNISLTYTLGFIKELTKEKDTSMILLMLGDFFANNPKMLTLDKERSSFWQISATTDLADFFYNFNNFYQSFCEEKDTSEASKIMIEGALEGALPIKIDLCSILNPTPLSSLLQKWGDGLAQKKECKIEDNNKIKIDYEFENDGCIRIPNDLKVLSGLIGLLQNIPGFSLPLTAIAFSPQNFFGNPTSLRNFLPLVRKISQDGKEKYLFVIEKEEQGKDEEHFKGEIFTLEYNENITRFGNPVLDATPIPKDCVPNGPLYIAFSDPTLNNSLFITTYYVSGGDNCLSWEQEEGLADAEYYKVFDKINQNYAINKLINKILSGISRLLPE